METLIANLTGKVRRDTLAGRECLVVPLSMIVPGILNGSRGPLLYESPELKRSVDAWNGMPIVLRHPTIQGSPVSARTPKVLNNYALGTVFASKFDGKLKAEGWFDVQNTERLAPEVLSKLKKGEPLELSTGLFADYVPAEAGATFNGQAYDFKVQNMRPDHLAVLPDERGACSLKDGCGVLINEWSDAARQAAAESRKKKSTARKSARSAAGAARGKGKVIGSGMKARNEAAARRQKILDKKAQAKGYKDHADRQAKIQAYKKTQVAAARSRRLAAEAKAKSKGGTNNAAVMKKEGTESLPASAYAYVPDPQKPSTWKLRIDDAVHVGGAVAAIGKGYRGNRAMIPPNAMAGVRAKIRAAWKKFHPDKAMSEMPDVLNSLTLNELSFHQIHCELQEALGEKFTQGDSYACVTDVYEDYFIYQQGGDLYKQLYTKSDAGVQLSGEPVEVERVVTFVPEPEESGESSGEGEMDMARNAAEKKAVIDSLIANSCGCWTEQDREVLNQFKDERLDTLVANAVKYKEQEQITNAVKSAVEAGVIVVNEGKIEAKKAEAPTPTTNSGPVDLKEYLKTAPPEVARIVQNALASEEREKAELITKITANKSNQFTKEALQAMGLETLKPLAALAATPAGPAYFGQAVPVNNRQAAPDEAPLLPPTINWEQPTKQSA